MHGPSPPAATLVAPVLYYRARCPDEVRSYETIRAPIGEHMKNMKTRTKFLETELFTLLLVAVLS